MIKYSLTNCDSTLGENIRYLMHKYEFDMHQWYSSITSLFNKIELYITSHILLMRIDAQAWLLGNYAVLPY